MSSSNNNNSFPEPGSEITSVHKHSSPAGLQARAAATQSQAPAGTFMSDPSQAAPLPQQAGINTTATNHDPTLNFSSPGMQARAAAAGQAPAGTAQPEYISSAPQPSDLGNSSPMGIAPDTIEASNQTPPTHIQAEPEPVPYTPINSLNTAREVFQPTSSNQHQPQNVEQPAAAPSPYSYGSTATNEAPASYAPQQSIAGQAAQRAATQTASSAPQGTHYTGSNSSYTFPDSRSQAPATFAGHQSSSGAAARNAALQTPGSAPAGTSYSTSAGQFSEKPYSYTPPPTGNADFYASTTTPSTTSSYASGVPLKSSAGSAARAAAAGQHPAGTGPDAGIIAQATAHLASQQQQQFRNSDVSKHFSPAGAQARAAATQAQAPSGTALAGSHQTSYEAPTASARLNLEPDASISPGMQARSAAYGQHPAGTGPGSVKGVRSYSTLSRVAPVVLRGARLLRR